MSGNRHQAREAAIEALYAWESSGQDDAMLPAILAEKIEDPKRKRQDVEYLRECVLGVAKAVDRLDEEIRAAARGRSLRSIGAIELAILRLSTWELAERLEIPYRVVIHEALRRTEDYAEPAAKRFVNAVLDRIAHKLRAVEIEAERNAQHGLRRRG